jgi:WD40 repeat protein
VISSITFSPDGSKILTTSQDWTAQLVDVRSAGIITAFVGHQQSVESGGFSADGREVVTASDDGSVRLWNAADGKPLQVFH